MTKPAIDAQSLVRAPTAPSGKGSYSAPAAACAADLLQILARSPEPLPLAQLARDLGRTKSLVFRVIRELEVRALIHRREDGRYSLGVGTLELGGAYLGATGLGQSVRQIMRDLSRETGETTNLGVLSGSDIIYLIRNDGRDAVLTLAHVGKRIPASCTAMGKVLLAQLDDRELHAVLQDPLPHLTSHSIGTLAELKKELQVIRQQGYARDEQEAILGRCCVAVTMPYDVDPAAISISVSPEGFAEREQDLLKALLVTRDRIGREIHGRSAIQGEGSSESLGER